MKLNEAISLRVKELCGERKLKPYSLGIKTGVASSTIDDLIKCKNETIKIRIIYEIVTGLNMELKDFFDSPYFCKENLID